MNIASLSPAVTEILFSLEQQKSIVCTDQFSDFPEGAKAIPHLRDHQKIDTETLRQFQPEVVFTSTLVQEKLAKKLKGEGFGVIYQDPRSIHEIYASIREIATILGCEPRAHALIETLQQGFNATKKKSGLFFRKPKVYVEEWHHPPMVSGNWVPEVVKMAGGIPYGVVSGQWSMDGDGRNSPSREVSLEEIRSFDPDMIVLSICGAGSVASKELLTTRSGWNELRAVKENHLFVIDDSLLNRPGPRLVEGCARLFGWMFQVLH
jgi:iron complex transport system substrate-binding protein